LRRVRVRHIEITYTYSAAAGFLVYFRNDTVFKIVPIRQKETTLEQKRPLRYRTQVRNDIVL
jgi:hypothetical protein